MEFLETLKKRRSVYALSSKLDLSNKEIAKLVKDVVTETPSAFNMQSGRVVVLFGEEHKKLWHITTETLRKIVPADKFAPTEAKMKMFSSGAGTIMFFEDEAVVDDYKAKFKTYASAFDMFASHGLGILQGNIWNALAAKGIGANLQHYNPLIDEEVKKTWNIPASYRLVSEMVFGNVEEVPAPVEKMDPNDRVKVFGA